MNMLEDTYVQITRGSVNKGAIGLIDRSFFPWRNYKLRYKVLFPNGRYAYFKSARNFKLFSGKNAEIAEKMFKYAQRKP